MLRGIVQFDTLNEVNIRLSDGSKAFDYDGYTNIIFKVLKADGTAYIDSEGENVIATSPVDGIITVNLTGQATTAAGLCQSVLEIYSGDGKMTTARFNYEVFEDLDLDEAVESTTEYPVFQNLMTDLAELEARITKAEAARVTAEAARASEASGYVTKAQEAAAEAEEWALQVQDIAKGDYVTRTELENTAKMSLPVGVVTHTITTYTAEDEDSQLMEILDGMPLNSIAFVVSKRQTEISPFGGGNFNITIYKASSKYATMDLRSYSGNGETLTVAGLRNIFDGVWKPWEYVNPMMTINSEYRTTERYLGKPVYVKAVDFGTLPNATVKSVGHGVTTVKFITECKLIASNGALITNDAGVDYCVANVGHINVKTSADYSAYTAVAVIKYTKTTDT